MANNPDWLCCALLFCSGLVIYGCIGIINYSEFPGKLAKSEEWAEPRTGAKWVEGQCIIHDTGISSRGGCWKRSVDAGVWNLGGVIPFSECPGLHWCADEGRTCSCVGDVLYSVAIFHSNLPVDNVVEWDLKKTVAQSKIPQSGNGNTVHSDGKGVKCAHGVTEAFSQDPQPFMAKACFCTPKRIVTLLQQKGPIHPEGQYCPAVANSAFHEESRHGVTSRRLQGTLPQEVRSVSNLTELWEYSEGHCHKDSSERGFFDQDYQVRLNWALVEVKEGSATVGGVSKLRCAYTYGAPDVSREDRKDNDLDIYKKWKSASGSTMPCYIRKGGVCGDSSCAVALKNPLELPKDHRDFGLAGPVLFISLGLLIPAACICFACYLVCEKYCSHGNSEFSESSSEFYSE